MVQQRCLARACECACAAAREAHKARVHRPVGAGNVPKKPVRIVTGMRESGVDAMVPSLLSALAGAVAVAMSATAATHKAHSRKLLAACTPATPWGIQPPACV